MDGFAGRGIYEDGEPGSPIIALEALITHNGVDLKTGTEFVFVFMEEDEQRCALLAEQVEQVVRPIRREAPQRSWSRLRTPDSRS